MGGTIDRLDYFPHKHRSRDRREYVRGAVDGMVKNSAPAYKSIAVKNIARLHKEGSEDFKKELAALSTPQKLQDARFVKKYKSPKDFPAAVKVISPTHGNPVISTSKDSKVVPSYADHPKVGAKLHPKYGEDKKPKHRFIGMSSVFVHRASDYIVRPKADIEALRDKGAIGGKSGVERENKEIMFAHEVESKDVAGYVPLVYPNLSKTYSEADKRLFGLKGVNPRLTKDHPKTLGKVAKQDSLHLLNSNLQWRVAARFAKMRAVDAELLWVDDEGKFRKFKPKGGIEKKLEYHDEDAGDKKEEADDALEAKIMRVGDENVSYYDAEFSDLFLSHCADDVAYITPQLSLAHEREALAVAIDEFKASPDKHQAVIGIHHSDHFMGIHIAKNNIGGVDIVYFDPTALPEKYPIPAHIMSPSQI